MKSLWQEEVRSELVGRLAKLSGESRPQWGKMNCQQMIAHLINSLEMSTGKLAVAPKGGPLRFPLFRYLVIYWLPFPKNVPTAQELLSDGSPNISAESAELSKLILQYRELANKRDWPAHPVFGTMSAQDWGVLGYRHIDHHFRQFGI